jgi:hypothetical protein
MPFISKGTLAGQGHLSDPGELHGYQPPQGKEVQGKETRGKRRRPAEIDRRERDRNRDDDKDGAHRWTMKSS